jgi:hypothetical protein
MTCADRSVSAAIGVVRTVAARMTRVVCFHINKSVACRPQVVPLSALCYRSVWFRGAALGLLFRLIYPVDRSRCYAAITFFRYLRLSTGAAFFYILRRRHSRASFRIVRLVRTTASRLCDLKLLPIFESLSQTWHCHTLTDMATLSVPSPNLGSASLGDSIHRPLSTHGLPKQPRTMSPERPHRFSAKSYPPPALVHTPMTPQSLGPMSPPPMSAKSFGTFIDSEPSTPAYSPRMDHEWGDSSVVLVRPMSSSSEPSSPTEPVWRMLQPLPVKAPPKPKAIVASPQSMVAATTAKEISTNTSLSSHPTKQARHISRPQEIKLADLSQQDYTPKSEDIAKDDEKRLQEQTASTPTAATFGKLATKMKLMLRRKNTNAKKKEKKKRQYEEVDRIEDVHWTEM